MSRRGAAAAPSPGIWRSGIRIPLIALLIACGEAPREPFVPRLVLLFAPCTVSRTFLAPYDAQVRFTPHLARFAENAITFERHRTEAGSSGTAYAALFSGSQADRHGVFQHPGALPEDIALLAEAYAEHGYETFFWSGHGMTSSGLRYDQGVPAENVFDRRLTVRDRRFEKLLKRLRADPTHRAFVMTTFTVTHSPYRDDFVERFLRDHPDQALDLPESELKRLIRLHQNDYIALAYNHEASVERLGLDPQAVARLGRVIELLYKANLARLDQIFGGILAAVDARSLRDESLIVFTAGHGEVLSRKNALFRWTHSSSLAPEVLDIPLLISSADPDLRPGRYAGVTRSIDVFPTLLGLSGLPVPGGDAIEGIDLAPALRGRAPAPDLLAYSHTAVIPRVVFEKMSESLARYKSRLVASAIARDGDRHLPRPEEEKALRALGYIR